MITPSGKLLGLDLTARDRAILELLYATGCRIQEAVGLDLDAVDLDDRTGIVRGKGNKEHGPVRPTSEAGARGMAGRLRETSPTLRGHVRVFLGQLQWPASRRAWRVRCSSGRDGQGRLRSPWPARPTALVRHASPGARHGPGGDLGAAGALHPLDHAAVHARLDEAPAGGLPPSESRSGRDSGVRAHRSNRAGVDVAPALSSCVRVTTAPVTWRTPATGAPCNSRRPSLRRIPAWRKPCSLSTTTI